MPALSVAKGQCAAAQSLVITNKYESTASIITLADWKTVATLPTGDAPHEVAVSHDGKWAVATDCGPSGRGGTTLTVIDVAARKVARTITFGTHVRPHGAVFLPDNRTVVVTAERSGALVLVDVVTGTIAPGGGNAAPFGLIISPKSDRAWITMNGTDQDAEVDLRAATLTRWMVTGAGPDGIGLVP